MYQMKQALHKKKENSRKSKVVSSKNTSVNNMSNNNDSINSINIEKSNNELAINTFVNMLEKTQDSNIDHNIPVINSNAESIKHIASKLSNVIKFKKCDPVQLENSRAMVTKDSTSIIIAEENTYTPSTVKLDHKEKLKDIVTQMAARKNNMVNNACNTTVPNDVGIIGKDIVKNIVSNGFSNNKVPENNNFNDRNVIIVERSISFRDALKVFQN